MVCSSPGRTWLLSREGEVYLLGQQLGNTGELITEPKKVSYLSDIISISCGGSHIVCLDKAGNLFTFGTNYFGKLGTRKTKRFLFFGDFTFTRTPQKVDIPPVKQISCGSDFTMCLLEDGTLFSFGCGNNGMLGHGDGKNYDYPKQIESLSDIEFVECGEYHTFCKTFDNSVYSWGLNNFGQLGIGETENKDTPFHCKDWPEDNVVDIKCGIYHTIVLTESQEVYSCGYSGVLGRTHCSCITSTLHQIEGLSNIIRIECGHYHSMCIDLNYDLYLFGSDSCRELGDIICLGLPAKNDKLSNIIDISKGGNHTFVKTSNNEIYAFGRNEQSQLGLTNNAIQFIPTQVFKGNEDIWCSNATNKPNKKSARK